MRKSIKTALALLCALLLLVPTCVFGSDGSLETSEETISDAAETAEAVPSQELTETSLEPPADAESPGSPDGKTPGGGEEGTEGGPDGPPEGGGEDDTEEETTYDYVEFGSYPQTEIVSQASDSGVYGKTWATENDYIVDAALYSALQDLSADAWDANGDTIYDGNKYRRIKSGDSTYIFDSKNTKVDAVEANCYAWSSADTYHYFKFEPIVWRVLEKDGSEYFLLSDIVLDNQMYNENIVGTDLLTWETSAIRSWLNGYGTDSNQPKNDYSSKNFIDTAFTPAEQEKIIITTVENADNIKHSTEGGSNTSDKIFLLSEAEVYGETAAAYGFASNADTKNKARRAGSSTYAKAMGTIADYEGDYLGGCNWWLRSPGSYPGLYAVVYSSGYVFRGGNHADGKIYGVRPAIRLNIGHIPGDLTDEGDVTVADLLRLLNHLIDATVEMAYDGDINNDGEVNLADVVRLLSHLIDQNVKIY